MTWKEVREKYPNQWIKLNILKDHVVGNKEYIDEMEVNSIVPTDLDAGRELVKCTENEVVYHTSHDEIYVEIRNIFGFRMVR
jgi:hypothetical protein